MKFTLNSQQQEILKTSIFFVDRERLLSSYAYPEDFIRYEIIPGRLGLRGNMWMGAVGLEGDFALLIPPAKRDIDAVGYSINWGEWDWWGFLSCITIPRGNFNVALSLSFSHETFFDLSQDVVCCLEPEHLKDEAHQICTHFSPDTSSVAEAWNAIWKVLQRELGAHVAGDEYQDL